MNRNSPNTFPLWINASVFAALVALGALSRFADAAPNFAAVGAIALFAGFFFSNRLIAALAPICAMLFSDALIGWHDPRQMAVVYACLIMPVLFRTLIAPSGKPTMWRVLGAAALGSVAFYLFTNAAVWVFGTMYTHDAPGLTRCFVIAIPFFRYTLASDLLFSGVLFGTYMLATRAAARRAPLAPAIAG